MATLGSDVLSFDEWVKRLTKDETRTIIEVVAADNRSLASMFVAAGNEADGNTSVARTSLPSGTWTSANEGVGTERSTTEELWDAAGTLETFSVINKRYVQRAANPKAARMQEEAAFAIGLSEEVEATVFYGDRASFPKEFTGLVPRYNSLLTGDNSDRVIGGGSGGSSSATTSMWLVNWGQNKCSLFFGKNHTGGLQTTDLGLGMVDLAGNGTHIMAYSTHYEWNVGLKVENKKSIARVVNVETSTYPALAELMIDAHYAVPAKMITSQSRWYVNRQIAGQLHKEARANTQVNLTLENWEGRLIPHFLGVPIIQTDMITNTEADLAES